MILWDKFIDKRCFANISVTDHRHVEVYKVGHGVAHSRTG